MAEWRILVFDSGVGGLTVARRLARLAPAGGAVDYAADFAGFPYGDWPEEALRARLVALVGRLLDRTGADAVVVACNTASTLALEILRASFPGVPFIGTVPAIKPAAAMSESGIIGVLATPGTVRREYTERLIHTFAYHRRVVLHGAPRLAALAERKLRGEAPDMAALREQIAPVFVRGARGARTDVVVLGCTHYPLLLKELREAAPWPVAFIDPAVAVARQALRILGLVDERRAWPCMDRFLVTGLAPGWQARDLRNLARREGFARLMSMEEETGRNHGGEQA